MSSVWRTCAFSLLPLQNSRRSITHAPPVWYMANPLTIDYGSPPWMVLCFGIVLRRQALVSLIRAKNS